LELNLVEHVLIGIKEYNKGCFTLIVVVSNSCFWELSFKCKRCVGYRYKRLVFLGKRDCV